LNKSWLAELQDYAKLGIYATLRLLAMENERPDRNEHTWKYFSERLYQVAHLQPHEELNESSEEAWFVKRKVPDTGLLRGVCQCYLRGLQYV
jgi:hypothetical protein